MYKKLSLMCWHSLGLGILVLSAQSAHAAGTQTFTKELLTPTSAKAGEMVTYRFKLACSSLTADCGNLTVEDTLPVGLEVVNCAIPTGFSIVSCDVSNPVVKITKDDLLQRR